MNFSKLMLSSLNGISHILTVLIFAVMPTWAQVSTAIVSGYVEDASGARLPGVVIRLLNLQTGNENVTTTDAVGEFLMPGVLPDVYSMQVQREGFAAVRLVGLSLSVGESRQLRVKLSVSTVKQSIDVDASGQSLNTEDVLMSTVVNSHLVSNLPLNGRSFQDLIAMTPGSVSVSPQAPRTGGFSVNGQSSDTNIYWVDGISGNFGTGPLDTDPKVPAAGQYASVTSLGTTHGLVALDALQEFRVVASVASAEYASTPGGQFSLLTRQGTSQIHVGAYAYLRNGYFDSADWFGGYNRIGNYSYYYQQDIGGTLSMPLTFGEQKQAQIASHFFGSYEELHVQQRTAPLVQYIPNPQLISKAPVPIQSAFAAFYAGRLPPDSNSESPGLVEYDYSGPSPPSFLRSMDFCVDHTFESRVTGFLRFGNTPSGSESTSTVTASETKLSNQSFTLGFDGQISSRAGNEFRVGWARASSSSVSSPVPGAYENQPVVGAKFRNLPTALGSPGSPKDTHSVLYMRIAGIGDTSAWTDGGANSLRQIEIRNTFSLQRGAHLIRAGIDARNLHSAVRPLPWTIESDYLSTNSVLSNAADFLIVRRNTPARPVFQQFAGFLQDQWKVTRNLNVSGGLRWDVNPPPSSSDGHDVFRVNGDQKLSAASLSISPRGTPLWNTDWLVMSPRIGVAWEPIQTAGRELVLRGGVGMLVDSPDRAIAPAFTALGFTSTTQLVGASIPTSAPPPPTTDVPNSGGLGYIFPQRVGNPLSWQWNVSLEQAASKHQSIFLSYVGASGHDLLLPQRRQIVSQTVPIHEVVTFPSGFSSLFNSLQLAYRGQYHSLMWMTSYVWGHTLDFGSPNPWAGPTRGNADTDVRHNLQVAASWTLPAPGSSGLVHNVFSGWGIDGRYFLRSSYPVTIFGNLFHDPVTGERFYTGADFIQGKPLYLSNSLLPGGRMLNGGPNVSEGAFQLPAGNSQGNSPRNKARGFGSQQLSLSLRRDIHLYDRLYLQLRGDVFNVFNNPDFGYIVPNLSDQLFGQPTLSLNQSYGQSGSLYQPGGPRSLQWMFRVRW